MATISKVISFLRGKKTYIVGVLEIALGIATKNQEMFMLGLSTITMRAGIAKLQ